MESERERKGKERERQKKIRKEKKYFYKGSGNIFFFDLLLMLRKICVHWWVHTRYSSRVVCVA